MSELVARLSREAAAGIIDELSPSGLIDYVIEARNQYANAAEHIGSLAATLERANAELEELRAIREQLNANTRALRAGFADSMRGVLAAVREALPDSVADELREEFEGSLREELADELRDELREEVQEECAEEVRDAFDRIGWL